MKAKRRSRRRAIHAFEAAPVCVPPVMRFDLPKGRTGENVAEGRGCVRGGLPGTIETFQLGRAAAEPSMSVFDACGGRDGCGGNVKVSAWRSQMPDGRQIVWGGYMFQPAHLKRERVHIRVIGRADRLRKSGSHAEQQRTDRQERGITVH